MSNYEITLVISPDMAEFEAQKVEAKIHSSITKKSGSITNNNLWGKHELAYPIKGHEFGYYTTTVFNMPGASLGELMNEIRLMPEIIRYLVISLEKENIKVEDLKKMDLFREQPLFAKPVPRTAPMTVRLTPAAPKKDEATRMKELEEKLGSILDEKKEET